MNVRIRCPNPECSASFSVPAELIGRHGRCRQCGASVPITRERESSPPETVLAPEPPEPFASTLAYSPSASRPQAPTSDSPNRSSPPETGLAPEPARSLASTLASSAFKPASRPRTPPTDPPEQFGRFRILGRLGRGGMGSVYKAYDSQVHRQVALKIPHFGPEDGPAVVERFYREGRTAATFDHPNLCPVYTVDQVDGVHYLTMPLLDGQPLSKCFEGRHPLPQRPVAALVRMLALAMEEAHCRGVVHRDLKPSNIMADRQRLLVIVDFGLSLRSGWRDSERHRAVPLQGDERLTEAGSVLGTPAYMAPEQVTGETGAIGPACDIYSLGVIIYELLTGRLPFEGPSAVVLGLIRVSEPPRPSSFRPDLNPGLDAICLKAMARRTGDRFASMGEFAASLKVFLDHGESTQAGMVPAGLLKPPLRDNDAPTSEEQQLVERLLAGTAQVLHRRRPEPQKSSPRIGRFLLPFLLISAITAALCLLVDKSLFAPWRDTPARGVSGSIPRIFPSGGATGNPRSRVGPTDKATLVAISRWPPTDQSLGKIRSSGKGSLTDSNDEDEFATSIDKAQPPGRQSDEQPSLKLVRRIQWPGNHIFHTAFSPDGQLYLGGGDTGTLRIWEVATGNQRLELPVTVAWFTPDGERLLGHKGDKTSSVFGVTTGKQERTWKAPEAFGSVAFSPDGKQVVTGHADNILRIWDFAKGMELRTLEGHAAWPSAVFSPDGKQILSSSVLKTIRLWDAETGRVVRTFDDFRDATPIPGNDLIIQAYFLPGGHQIAGYVWATESTLLVLDATNGKVVRKIDLGGDFHKDLAISADGRWLLTGHGGDRTVRLRDLMTGKEVSRFGLTDVNVPRAVGFSPDGRYAVAGSHRNWVYLWQLQK